jgi:predicted MFS family arabinose efflux permease
VVFSLHGGAIADRLGYLRVTRFNTGVMALLAALFSGLIFAGQVNVWTVLAFTTLIGSVNALTTPAQISLVHPIVPKEDLSAAIAVNSATFNVARFIGPAIAGVLIIWASIALVIALYAASLFVFFIMLMRIRMAETQGAGADSAGLLADIANSLRYVGRTPGLFFIMVLMGVTGLFIRPYMELLPGFSAQVFGMDADGLAILTSATGFGAIFSGLWLARRGRTEGLTHIVTLTLGLSAVALFGFVATDHIWFAAFCVAGTGFFFLAGGVASQTLIQNAVDSAMRARVMSLFAGISWGVPALGALVMGWTAEFLGLRPVVGAGALATAAVWIWAAKAGPRLRDGLEGEGTGVGNPGVGNP